MAEYRNEILQEIKQHIQRNEDITDIIIAGDYNQDIRDRAIKRFHIDLGVSDVHSKINNIPSEQLDKIYKHGSKPIDSIAATAGVIDYIERCQLVDYNKIIEIDHRGFIVNVVLDEYFELEFSS